MEKVTLIRQRPGVGDCLLLSPLIREIKKRHPLSKLTVLTDASYMDAALVDVFLGIEGVDRIECEPLKLTQTPGYALPFTARNADHVFNCNNAFLSYEHQTEWHPKLSIAEFWLKHFGFETEHALPKFKVSAEHLATTKKHGKYDNTVGIVLKAGHRKRDWPWQRHIYQLAAGIRKMGYHPLTISLDKSVPSIEASVNERIPTLAAMLAMMPLLITPDTGLLHLAQAVGTKTIGIWGIMPPELRTKNYACTIVPPEPLPRFGDCICCLPPQRWSCLQRITADLILEAAKQVLSG